MSRLKIDRITECKNTRFMRFPYIDSTILHPVIYNECPVNVIGADLEVEGICIRIAKSNICARVDINIRFDLGLYELCYVSKPLIGCTGHCITVRVLSYGIVTVIEEVR